MIFIAHRSLHSRGVQCSQHTTESHDVGQDDIMEEMRLALERLQLNEEFNDIACETIRELFSSNVTVDNSDNNMYNGDVGNELGRFGNRLVPLSAAPREETLVMTDDDIQAADFFNNNTLLGFK